MRILHPLERLGKLFMRGKGLCAKLCLAWQQIETPRRDEVVVQAPFVGGVSTEGGAQLGAAAPAHYGWSRRGVPASAWECNG